MVGWFAARACVACVACVVGDGWWWEGGCGVSCAWWRRPRVVVGRGGLLGVDGQRGDARGEREERGGCLQAVRGAARLGAFARAGLWARARWGAARRTLAHLNARVRRLRSTTAELLM